MKRCLAALALLLALPQAGAATSPGALVAAAYAEPTTRYPHGVLGDDVEWGALHLTLENCADCDIPARQEIVIRLPAYRVFEDTAPRLVDLNGDGRPLVLVVESDARQGARLAVYSDRGFVAGTPFIGTRNRWLAPIGAADLDGDGAMELAYIDRPHLAKTLRVWRWRDNALSEVASLKGLTNHRIGETDIAGGMRSCAGQPEMIVATSNWARLIAVSLRNGMLSQRDIGPHANRESFSRALRCD